MTVQDVLAIVAGLTAPACGFLAWWLRRVYGDLQAAQAQHVELVREVLRGLAALERLDSGEHPVSRGPKK